MTMVTAMVSPKARANARKMDPMIPSRAWGTTTCQVDSHLVAPSARAASRCSRGTASSDSREMEMINGKVMIARIKLAASNRIAEWVPVKKGRNPRVFFRNGST